MLGLLPLSSSLHPHVRRTPLDPTPCPALTPLAFLPLSSGALQEILREDTQPWPRLERLSISCPSVHEKIGGELVRCFPTLRSLEWAELLATEQVRFWVARLESHSGGNCCCRRMSAGAADGRRRSCCKGCGTARPLGKRLAGWK